MSLLDRIDRERGRRNSGSKAWSGLPPFWAQPDRLIAADLPREERIGVDYEGVVTGAAKASGPVFGCIMRRAQVFSQGRFQWTRYTNGMPSDPFGSESLRLLEQPWPNGTTGELLTRMEFDASIAGNSFWTTADEAGRIGRAARGSTWMVRMRPDWCRFIIDAPSSNNPYGLDARVVALLYETPRRTSDAQVTSWLLMPDEFMHYSPTPDPIARHRGMSWLTPILEEIQADVNATKHKGKIFTNGASYTRAIKFDKDIEPDAYKRFKDRYTEAHRGVEKAYGTLFLLPGADVVPLSMDFQQLDFKVTQGAGETRICVASGVPAPIAGVSEGLAGSALNAGNLGVTRRLFVDTTIRDLWNKAAPSLAGLIDPPRGKDGAVLIVDDRFIPFLREDARDRADIAAVEAKIITSLVRDGFKSDTAIAAVRNMDWKLLQHTGMLSVQLHSPGESMASQSTPMPITPNGANGVRNGSQASLSR